MKPPRDPRLQALLAQPSRVLFLDIETTGLSHYYDKITLLGWSVGQSYEVAFPWESTDRFKRALQEAVALDAKAAMDRAQALEQRLQDTEAREFERQKSANDSLARQIESLQSRLLDIQNQLGAIKDAQQRPAQP